MEKLRERRKAAGLSQETLAHKIGRSTATVRLYEAGTEPPPEVRQRIEAVLGLPSGRTKLQAHPTVAAKIGQIAGPVKPELEKTPMQRITEIHQTVLSLRTELEGIKEALEGITQTLKDVSAELRNENKKRA